MTKGSNNNSEREFMGSVFFFFAIAGLAIVFIAGLTSLGEMVGFGPVTFGSKDPKKPLLVVHVAAVVFAVLLLGVLALTWIVREVLASIKLDELKSMKQKLLEADASHAITTQKLAELESRIPVIRLEQRKEVELEWQRDTKAELEQENALYLNYVNAQRNAKAEFEAAKQQRAHRLLQLEEFVEAAYPEFAQRTDPTGTKGPQVVSAAFRKHIAKKVPDAGILRLSQDTNVRAMLGPLTDFAPEPPPIMPPILIPVPERLRRRFEG